MAAGAQEGWNAGSPSETPVTAPITAPASAPVGPVITHHPHAGAPVGLPPVTTLATPFTVKVLYKTIGLQVTIHGPFYTVYDIREKIIESRPDELYVVPDSWKLQVWSRDLMTWVDLSDVSEVSNGGRLRFVSPGLFGSHSVAVLAGSIGAAVVALGGYALELQRRVIYADRVLRFGEIQTELRHRKEEFESFCMWENMTQFGRWIHRLQGGKLMEHAHVPGGYKSTDRCIELRRSVDTLQHQQLPPYPTFISAISTATPTVLGWVRHISNGITGYLLNVCDIAHSFLAVIGIPTPSPHRNPKWWFWTSLFLLSPWGFSRSRRARRWLRRKIEYWGAWLRDEEAQVGHSPVSDGGSTGTGGDHSPLGGPRSEVQYGGSR